jgi:hypothetical protein
MRKMMTGIVLSGLLVSASGCYRVNVATRAPSGGGEVERKAWTFLYGLIGDDVVSPCPAASVETRMSVGDWFIGAITLGLVHPRTVRIECAAVAAPAVVSGPPGVSMATDNERRVVETLDEIDRRLDRAAERAAGE